MVCYQKLPPYNYIETQKKGKGSMLSEMLTLSMHRSSKIRLSIIFYQKLCHYNFPKTQKIKHRRYVNRNSDPISALKLKKTRCRSTQTQ